jgi:sugar transferase (PEP-CTERM/EpsH1 system associated)
MRILMLCHRLPFPPLTGDRVRAFHIARYLSQRHRLTLAFPAEGLHEKSSVHELRRYVPDLEFAEVGRFRRQMSVLHGLIGSVPLTVKYFASAALAQKVRRRLDGQPFDLVYVSSSAMAPYALPATAPFVMDFVDVDSEKWSQYAERCAPPFSWIYALESRRLQRFERDIAHCAVLSLFSSQAEETLFQSFAPGTRTVTLPNGVDTGYFSPGPSATVTRPTIIFTGALDYFPNIDAVCHFSRTIWPLIRQRVPEVRLLVVGRRPAAPIRRLEREPGLAVLGDVPDVRPYMRKAQVAVVPLRMGRGIQNKVLEAMAMGLPVVASPQPAQGIAARVGVEWFVEDGREAFASRVVTLLRNQLLRADVGARARLYVERTHAWSTILSRLEGLLRACLRATPSTCAATADRIVPF